MFKLIFENEYLLLERSQERDTREERITLDLKKLIPVIKNFIYFIKFSLVSPGQFLENFSAIEYMEIDSNVDGVWAGKIVIGEEVVTEIDQNLVVFDEFFEACGSVILADDELNDGGKTVEDLRLVGECTPRSRLFLFVDELGNINLAE